MLSTGDGFSKENHDSFNRKRREEFVRSTLDGNREILKENMGKGRGLSWKTILLLVIGSSTITMGSYVAIQIYKFKKDGEPRVIFLPLWLNLNWIYTTNYTFPDDLWYIDKDFYHFLMTESDTLNEPPKDLKLDKYSYFLQENSIKYKVLEALSANQEIRKIFKVPLPLTLESKTHRTWIEPRYPVVLGLQIQMSNDAASKIESFWVIRPINFHSIADESLVQAGLALNKLGNDNSFEMNQYLDDQKPSIIASRNYNIMFQGSFFVFDKALQQTGKVKYYGCVDFNHIKLNEGVKLLDLELSLEDGSISGVNYKII